MRTIISSNCFKFYSLVVLLLGWQANAEEKSFEDASYEVTKQFWDEFVAEQAAANIEKKKEYLRSWKMLQKQHQTKIRAMEQEEINRLLAARARYERTVTAKTKTESIPFALLNLAQINALLASTEDGRGGSGTSDYESYLAKALETIYELRKNHPEFELLDQALYLEATLHEDTEQPEKAFATWKKLANFKQSSLPVIHANIAAGDFLFNNEDPKAAIPFFQRARVLSSESSYKEQEWDAFRIKYRIAWASYRSAQIEMAINTSIAILETPRTFGHLEESDKIVKDTIEILGDALYERNNYPYTKKILRKQSIKDLSPRVALRVLSRSMAHNLYEQSIEVSEVGIAVNPLSLEAPALLRLNALAHDKAGNELAKILSLEQLALLLPSDSLWLSKNEINFGQSQEMKRIAVKAGRIVAAHHYEQGLATGKSSNFKTAASFFEILLQHRPSHSSAPNWRLRLAHCAYLSGDLEGADRQYANIRDDNRSDKAAIEVASYQLVLAREKVWRNAYGGVAAEGAAPAKDPQVVGALNRLEAATINFANRFPDSTRGIDLLLLTASAHRDHKRYHSAKQLWKRAIISQPTISQRMTAIRGIVYATVQGDSPEIIIQTAADLLRLEDWRHLGKGLRNELLGVLASATETEGNRLRNAGEVALAATVLVEIASEFPALPKRQQLWRNGAYLFAIAGDWLSAHAATEKYRSSELKAYAADMKYLQARSLEYQMKFRDSSSEFLAFAKQHPKHRKASAALWRAYKLADAENIDLIAGMAMRLLADRTTKTAKKQERYSTAIDHFATDKSWERALDTAVTQKTTAKTTEQQLRAQINVASIRYRAGQESIALKELSKIAKSIRSKKSKLGNRYAPMLSEVEFTLAEEALDDFNGYNIFERNGELIRSINTKTSYFQDVAKKLDDISRLEDPRWAAKARYHLAVSAERLSNDVSKAVNLHTSKIGAKSVNSLKATSKRLKNMAKRYFADNLIARSRMPAAYRNNRWIKRSAIRLANYQEVDYKPQHADELQASVNFEIPQSWSL